MENWYNDNDGGNEVLWENPSHCQFVYVKSYIHWLSTEQKPILKN